MYSLAGPQETYIFRVAHYDFLIKTCLKGRFSGVQVGCRVLFKHPFPSAEPESQSAGSRAESGGYRVKFIA